MNRGELLSQLLTSPLAKEIERQDAERQHASREAWAKEIAALDRDHAKKFPVLKEKARVAEQAVGDAQAALRAAQADLAAAYREQVGASLAHSQAKAELESRLRESADPRIQQFVQRQRAAIDAVRRGADDPPAVGARKVAGAVWAISQAEELQLLATTDVVAALERIADTTGVAA